ncbi:MULTISPECIES: hypothetical protein [unclassified Cupriavidus]|uniref:hypothetical protein n=1 Tax=unclassified Cupriavidus TaxID=2640874 RepID=UPI00048DD478|nr:MULTISPECIES: hypothetical protein [unclassified Cupriavidus]MBP0630711.1 hypothetical protein [Cupriavidus sp. AcVe19-1a]MBP0637373.1 hypothetical protein [Cupriavidus sp. AcVe19-6a]
MRRTVAWICAALATLLAVAVVYWFGISPLTILLAILLLSCPIVVMWMSWQLSRQCERDIQQAVDRERKVRGNP